MQGGISSEQQKLKVFRHDQYLGKAVRVILQPEEPIAPNSKSHKSHKSTAN